MKAERYHQLPAASTITWSLIIVSSFPIKISWCGQCIIIDWNTIRFAVLYHIYIYIYILYITIKQLLSSSMISIFLNLIVTIKHLGRQQQSHGFSHHVDDNCHSSGVQRNVRGNDRSFCWKRTYFLEWFPSAFPWRLRTRQKFQKHWVFFLKKNL